MLDCEHNILHKSILLNMEKEIINFKTNGEFCKPRNLHKEKERQMMLH